MLNLGPLFMMLESEGLTNYRIVLVDYCGNIETADTDYYPEDHKPDLDVEVEAELVRDVLGDQTRCVMGLWELVEEVARRVAVQTREDWSRAEVEFLIEEGQVDVEVQVKEYKMYKYDIREQTLTEA